MSKPYTIAIAGKGGTGKTTLAALIIYSLLKAGKTPILGVDADPNTNLNELLGIQIGSTIISKLDELVDKKEELPAGVTKQRHLEYQLNEALVEANGFDLLVMGRTEGPGCYCYANNMLRSLVDKISGGYPYMVMDNEAGMEHLSRRTTRHADALLIAANPSVVSLRSARRIYDTARELKLDISRVFLVLNNMNPDTNINNALMEDTGLELLAHIPYDAEIAKRSIEARPLLDMENSSPAVKAAGEMMQKIL